MHIVITLNLEICHLDGGVVAESYIQRLIKRKLQLLLCLGSHERTQAQTDCH